MVRVERAREVRVEGNARGGEVHREARVGQQSQDHGAGAEAVERVPVSRIDVLPGDVRRQRRGSVVEAEPGRRRRVGFREVRRRIREQAALLDQEVARRARVDGEAAVGGARRSRRTHELPEALVGGRHVEPARRALEPARACRTVGGARPGAAAPGVDERAQVDGPRNREARRRLDQQDADGVVLAADRLDDHLPPERSLVVVLGGERPRHEALGRDGDRVQHLAVRGARDVKLEGGRAGDEVVVTRAGTCHGALEAHAVAQVHGDDRPAAALRGDGGSDGNEAEDQKHHGTDRHVRLRPGLYRAVRGTINKIPKPAARGCPAAKGLCAACAS